MACTLVICNAEKKREQEVRFKKHKALCIIQSGTKKKVANCKQEVLKRDVTADSKDPSHNSLMLKKK